MLALFTAILAGVAGGSAAGNVITSPDTAGDVGWVTSLALNGGENPVVSYNDHPTGDLKVRHCGDATCSSGDVITSPDTAGNVGEDSSLVLDASGYPVVSYIDGYPNKDLKILHCGNANCSAGNVITSPDTAGDVGGFTSLTLDASGYPVVSYWDSGNGDLKVLHCGDPTCSSGNVITSPDTVGGVGFFTSLTLDGSGNPVVSYYDYTNENLKVLHCGNPNCSSGNVITSPDTTGDVGKSTSLALDASGYPVVSYHDVTNRDLKLLHCGNANCTSGNVITSPDTVGWVGQDTSLALDASGYPVVSYRDGDNSGLKVLHCGDPTCSSGNVSTSPDTVGLVGFFTSLALDGSGNPVVSYFDEDNGDLKVLRCGDPYCGAASPPTPSPTPTPTPTPVGPTPTPTGAPPAGRSVVWGDSNCSGSANPVDSLLTLRFDAGLSISTGDCPNFGQVVDVQNASPHPWGDVDCGGDVTPVDSLKLLRYDAGLGVPQAAGCPAIGSLVILDAAATPSPTATATAGATATATPTLSPSPTAGPTVSPSPTTSCPGPVGVGVGPTGVGVGVGVGLGVGGDAAPQ